MSYSSMIPDKLQNELIQIRDEMTRKYWRIGDICQEVKDYLIFTEQEFSMEEIYSAVGAFVGKPSRTVREYFSLAQFYPDEIREQFSVLAFDHFRHASRFGDQAIQVLQWAVEQGDTLNRPATVDAMLARFATPDPSMPEPPPDLPEGPSGIFIQIYQSVSQQVQASRYWMEHGDLSPHLLARVQVYHEAASELSKVLCEVGK